MKLSMLCAILHPMSVKKIFLAVACVFFLGTAKVSAQSADAVSAMIETPAVSFCQAAYFMAVYAVDSDAISEAEALDFCIDAGLCSIPSDPEKLITLSELAGMCMRTFNLKGGIMYTITKSNHYAFREMQAKGFIAKNADPSATVTGSNALILITECIHAVEVGNL